MSNGMIVRLVPLSGSMFAVGASTTWGIDAAFPVGNLADRQPKTVAQTAAATSGTDFNFQINLDLGADVSIDTLAVMFTNLSSTATWTVYAGPASDGGFVLSGGNLIVATGAFGITPTTRENRRHGLWTVGAPISRRYISILLTDTPAANLEQVVRAGIVAVGQRLMPVWNFELGSGRKVESQSIVRQLPGGETLTEEGGNTPIWRGTWSNLSEAELRSLWSILMEVGIGKPLLIIEDPDAVTGQAEAIHYGQLTSLDFHERVQLEKQRIDLAIRELV